jgi:hypothetical protein
MLEFEDIQHITVTRVPAITGRYEFLSFREPAQGRAWLAGILDKVASAQGPMLLWRKKDGGFRSPSLGRPWRARVDKTSLATYPENSARAWSRVRKCLAIPAKPP